MTIRLLTLSILAFAFTPACDDAAPSTADASDTTAAIDTLDGSDGSAVDGTSNDGKGDDSGSEDAVAPDSAPDGDAGDAAGLDGSDAAGPDGSDAADSVEVQVVPATVAKVLHLGVHPTAAGPSLQVLVAADGRPGTLNAEITYLGETPQAPEAFNLAPSEARIFFSSGTASPPTADFAKPPESGLSVHLGDAFSAPLTDLDSSAVFGELTVETLRYNDAITVTVSGLPAAIEALAPAITDNVRIEGWTTPISLEAGNTFYTYTTPYAAADIDLATDISATVTALSGDTLDAAQLMSAANDLVTLESLRTVAGPDGPEAEIVYRDRDRGPRVWLLPGSTRLTVQSREFAAETTGAASNTPVGVFLVNEAGERFASVTGVPKQLVSTFDVPSEVVVAASGVSQPTTVTLNLSDARYDTQVKDASGPRMTVAVHGDLARLAAGVEVEFDDGQDVGGTTETLSFRWEWVRAFLPLTSTSPHAIDFRLETEDTVFAHFAGTVTDDAPEALLWFGGTGTEPGPRPTSSTGFDNPSFLAPAGTSTNILSAFLSSEGGDAAVWTLVRSELESQPPVIQVSTETVELSLTPTLVAGRATYFGPKPASGGFVIEGITEVFSFDNRLVSYNAIGEFQGIGVYIDARSETTLEVAIEGSMVDLETAGIFPGADLVTADGVSLPYVSFDRGWMATIPELSDTPEGADVAVSVSVAETAGGEIVDTQTLTELFGFGSFLHEITALNTNDSLTLAVIVDVYEEIPTTLDVQASAGGVEFLSSSVTVPNAVERIFSSSVDGLTESDAGTITLTLTNDTAPLDVVEGTVAVDGGWVQLVDSNRTVWVLVERDGPGATTGEVTVTFVGEEGTASNVASALEADAVDIKFDQLSGPPVEQTLSHWFDRVGFDVTANDPGLLEALNNGDVEFLVTATLEGSSPSIIGGPIHTVPSVPASKKFVKKYEGKTKFDRKMNEKFTDNAL